MIPILLCCFHILSGDPDEEVDSAMEMMRIILVLSCCFNLLSCGPNGELWLAMEIMGSIPILSGDPHGDLCSTMEMRALPLLVCCSQNLSRPKSVSCDAAAEDNFFDCFDITIVPDEEVYPAMVMK